MAREIFRCGNESDTFTGTWYFPEELAVNGTSPLNLAWDKAEVAGALTQSPTGVRILSFVGCLFQEKINPDLISHLRRSASSPRRSRAQAESQPLAACR